MTIRRHHGCHPPTGVKPNMSVNSNPGSYRAPETASVNNNPSLPGPVGIDAANSRLNKVPVFNPKRGESMDPRSANGAAPDNSDPDGDECECEEDRAPATKIFIG